MRRTTTWIVIMVAAVGSAYAEEPVDFADPALEAAVEETLGVLDPTPTDMLGLFSLERISGGITDLTGLEYATNLGAICLRWNHISDLSALSDLTSLRSLNLSQNEIVSLSPLSGLVDLEDLNVHWNHISDLSPLSGLTNLRELDIHGNEISDLSALAGLTGLWYLNAKENQISDLSPLSALTNLQELCLLRNQISDLSPLSGLTHLRELYLQENQISDVSPLSGLASLQMLHLSGNRIQDVSGLLDQEHLRELYLDYDHVYLNRDAYCDHLPRISYNNPGIDLRYDPNSNPPLGVSASDGTYADGVHITWRPVCNGPVYTSHYRVFRATADKDPKTAISPWQVTCGFDDTTAEPGTTYTYWVQTAVSSQGSAQGDYSLPDRGWTAPQPTLILSSTAGGSVVDPGEGTYRYKDEQVLTVRAQPMDPNLFVFVGWTGTAVEAGRVTELNRSPTTVVLDKVYTLKAHFVGTLGSLVVDDDAPGDPTPGDWTRDDHYEDGTATYPFDSIQEAIEVAGPKARVVVRGGLYAERLDLLGKGICVVGQWLIDPNEMEEPVVDGGGVGPVVSLTHGEGSECLVAGLRIRGGKAQSGAGIVCWGSSPRIEHCVVCGHVATGEGGGVIECVDSVAALVHCTVTDNVSGAGGGALVLVDSSVVVTNSIVWGNEPAEMVVRGVGIPVVTYTDMRGGRSGLGRMDADPLFAGRGCWMDPCDPMGVPVPGGSGAVWREGDYHERSQAGRWQGEGRNWVTDVVTSPCIDAGDPASAVGYEPMPNGSRVNLGAYGGTAQASKSPVAH